MSKEKEEKVKNPEPAPEPEIKKDPTVEDKLALLDQELAEVKDKYLRALAEMENFKKRNHDELTREKRYASMPVCDKMIDSLEVFDQVLGMPTEDPNLKNFLYGFKMIKDGMFSILNDEGVKTIDIQIGDVFDPNLAHAIEKTEDPGKNDNVIVKIIKKGYKYKDRLLRPAMVVINIKPAEPDPAPATDSAKCDKNVA
jgi:molecular chaperone GrpE